MKTVEEIIRQKPVYLHIWTEKIDVISEFECIYMTGKEYRSDGSNYLSLEYFFELKKSIEEAITKYQDVHILFASYSRYNCSGDSWVLFEQNNKLYEVNGSHCSCYGLEGQWDPEEVSLLELENRLINGTFGMDDDVGNDFRNELMEFLGISN